METTEPQSEDLEIEVTPLPRATEVLGEDPAQRDGQVLLPLGKPQQDACHLLLYPCLKQILAHGQRQPETEVAGVLLGRIWRCPRGLVTEMAEALPAEKTEASLGHVTFSHQTWDEIYNYLETSAPDLRIVGWYHTHPGFGVFYSEQDRFIQRNFFRAEGQLGLVVDPSRQAVAAYHCREGEVLDLPGLWIGTGRESATAARRLLSRLSYAASEREKKSLAQRVTEAVRNTLGGNGGSRKA